MRSEPMVDWTCDKCEKSVQVKAQSSPPGWVKVKSFPLNITDSPAPEYTADWCTTCKTTHLRRNVTDGLAN